MLIPRFSSSRLASKRQGSSKRQGAPKWRASLRLVLFVGLGGVSTLHCSSADHGPSQSGTGGTDGAPRDSSILELGDQGQGGATDELPLNPLCGVGDCVPDDPHACVDPGEGDSEGLGGLGGMGGFGGGVSFNPGDLDQLGASCQVAPQQQCGGGACAIERNCSASGSSAEGSPCVTAADCRAGLACVGEGLSGVCRPYCCRGTTGSCDDRSFCDERRLLETPEVYVPVCLPLDDCPLSDPFPCPTDRDCACQGNKACMVVRPDGKTACTVPGAGQAGDSCNDQNTADCAQGFVCGPNQVCLQICSTLAEETGCRGGGSCLKQSVLGGNLGICIATADGSEATR